MKRDPGLVRLSRDHHRGLALALRIERVLDGRDLASIDELRQESLDFWRAGLVPHFRAECECMLARLVRLSSNSEDLVARTQRDHVNLHGLFIALGEATQDANMRSILTQISETLRTHIRWEEAVLFQAVEGALGSSELRKLGGELAERLPEVPSSPRWYP